MSDLKSPHAIIAKGFLFLFLGLFAGVLLLLRHMNWLDAALLAISVWAFCRFYYFAFYVIEHYIDGDFKFSSLFAFMLYLIKRYRKSTV